MLPVTCPGVRHLRCEDLVVMSGLLRGIVHHKTPIIVPVTALQSAWSFQSVRMKQQSKFAMLISGLPGKGSFAVPVSADNVASYPSPKLQDRAFAVLGLIFSWPHCAWEAGWPGMHKSIKCVAHLS